MAATFPGKQRLVDGPELDVLERTEVAAYLRLSPRTVQRLIEAGEFPRPIMNSEGVPVWDWTDCLYWKLRCTLRPRLRPSRKRKLAEKPSDGQPPAMPGQGGTTGKRTKPET